MVCPLPGWKHGFILKTELTIKNGDIAGIQRGYVMGYNYPSVWLFFNQRYPAAVSSCNSQRAHFLDGSSQRARVSPGTFTNTLWESNIAMENSRNFLKYRCFFLFFEEFLLFIYIYRIFNCHVWAVWLQCKSCCLYQAVTAVTTITTRSPALIILQARMKMSVCLWIDMVLMVSTTYMWLYMITCENVNDS